VAYTAYNDTESKLLGVLSFDFVTNTTNVTFSDNYVTYEDYFIPAAIVATNDTVCICECFSILAYCIFIAINDATGAQLFFVKMSRYNGDMSFYEMTKKEAMDTLYIYAMTYISGKVYYAGNFDDSTVGVCLGYYDVAKDLFAPLDQGLYSSSYVTGLVAISQDSIIVLYASGSDGYDDEGSFWKYQCDTCAPITLFGGYLETSATLLDPITQVIYMLSSTSNIIGCILKIHFYFQMVQWITKSMEMSCWSIVPSEIKAT
jgi:hypothetical protein